MSEKFVEKRHIAHPRSTILLTRISRRKLQKLQSWVQSRDLIEICPCDSSREIFLINATRRPHDPQPSAAERETIKEALKRYHEEMKAQSSNQSNQSHFRINTKFIRIDKTCKIPLRHSS